MKVFAKETQGVPLHKGVKNVIAIASGKGGVGKSTIAANVTRALAQSGYRTGLLDADIYGPSQPTLFNVENPELEYLGDNRVKPLLIEGIQLMSIGFIVDENTPMVWRGPIVSKTLQQLFYYTAWDNLDYLIVDLPPGTGDAQLTLAQKIPVTGAVVITTPHPLAVDDVKRAIEMFKKVKVRTLGIIENMAYFMCGQCNTRHYIFEESQIEELLSCESLPLLGQIPIGEHEYLPEPVLRNILEEIDKLPKALQSKIPQVQVIS